MGGHPAWDLNPADLAVVSGECRSSFHHPTVSRKFLFVFNFVKIILKNVMTDKETNINLSSRKYKNDPRLFKSSFLT
jgi:hypothetical protein